MIAAAETLRMMLLRDPTGSIENVELYEELETAINTIYRDKLLTHSEVMITLRFLTTRQATAYPEIVERGVKVLATLLGLGNERLAKKAKGDYRVNLAKIRHYERRYYDEFGVVYYDFRIKTGTRRVFLETDL